MFVLISTRTVSHVVLYVLDPVYHIISCKVAGEICDVETESHQTVRAAKIRSGNPKGGRCEGVQCGFALGPKYDLISNGHNSLPLALDIFVVVNIFDLRKLSDLDILITNDIFRQYAYCRHIYIYICIYTI